MNYKVQGAINKNKKTFIIAIVLWLFIAIVFIPPLACCIFAATYNGGFEIDRFINTLLNTLCNSDELGFDQFSSLNYHETTNEFRTEYEAICAGETETGGRLLLVGPPQ